MYKILQKKVLNENVIEMDVFAPLIANKAKPGQFIILRVDKEGERIPLTIAGTNINNGSVKIIFQIVGATTFLLNKKNAGDCIEDFVGPLGKATEIDDLKNVCVIGGGVGCAIALPIAKALHDQGTNVTTIIGFRSKDLVILEEEFKCISNEFHLMTDDGTYGEKGNVTVPLDYMLKSGKKFDKIFAIGPIIMMKFVVLTAKPYNIPVIVSMNPIMIDGTGMCGGCRLTLNVNGERQTKFACVDGPDFDGYEVDFDEAMMRGRMYADFEKHEYEKTCNLFVGR